MLWCDVAVLPYFSWPNQPIGLPFEGWLIVLSPPTERLASRASLLAPNGTTFEEGGAILSRFLSRLAWSKNGGVVELFHGGSNMPGRPGLLGGDGARGGWGTVAPAHMIYLPAPTSKEADLALALYREGLSVNSIPFAFLSFFKIFNIRFSSGSKQEQWINSNLHRLWYSEAVDRLAELQKLHQDIGKYLYVQGRCAVAHAHGSPLVNPDEYADRRRLREDLPLLKELVALFIEQELGVLSESSFHRTFDPKLHADQALMQGSKQEGWILYAPYRCTSNAQEADV